MQQYFDIFLNAYEGYASYLFQEITNPHWHNYFYWLLLVSAFFFVLEMLRPWRKKQSLFRKDFWLDFFYMFFNFFLFSLIIYNAASDVVVHFFNNSILSLTGFNLQASNPLQNLDMWAILLIGFFVRDFVQWWIHRLLHKSDTLWEFHKVHHSVEQMGFAAHLRYHWMEPVVYKSLLFIPIAMIGNYNAKDVAIVYFLSITIGHLNHANLGWDYGILKYVFNNPKMHIWHHAKALPEHTNYGVNYGITLSIWDYLFKTDYIPHNGRDIELGFDGDENFPKDFIGQEMYPLSKKQ